MDDAIAKDGPAHTTAHPSPSPPEIARTAVASARLGTLWSASPTVRCQAMTAVRISVDPGGRPILLLDPRSPIVRTVAAQPVVHLAVAAPVPFRSLQLTGPAERHRCADTDGLVAYRMVLLSAHFVGARRMPVTLAQYAQAQADPLADHAPAVLAHLGEQHGAELTACVRAHGKPEAEWVSPQSLDRYGLELAVVTAEGVTTMRLVFPNAPLGSLREVATYLRIALTCPCQCPPRSSAS